MNRIPIFLSVLLVLATGPWAISSPPDSRRVTVSYTQGRRGYSGAAFARMDKNRPDVCNVGDVHAGFLKDPRQVEMRSLIKFTGLDLPAGSQIISARMTLFADGISGHPELAAYGLLREWCAEDTTTHRSVPQASWKRALAEGKNWSAPGAGKASDRFEYDKQGDHFRAPDAVVKVPRIGAVVFDVTRSFTDQFNRGKNYGWLIVEQIGQPETHAHFGMERVVELAITFEPPTGATVPVPDAQPRLITFHLAEPQGLVKDLARANALPFEGAVFLGQGDDNTDRSWIANGVCGPDRIDFRQYSNFIAAAKKVSHASPLTHNFLRINLTVPGTLEKKDQPYTWSTRPRGEDKVRFWWAEGFDTVVHNLKVAAQVAKESGCKGLLLDWEEYGGNIWNYDLQQDATEMGKSLPATRPQVRRRAEQLMRTMNDVYPEMTLLVIPWLYDRPGHQPTLLWADFVDGLFSAADPRIRIVDGNEMGYYINAQKEFQEMYDWDYVQAPAHGVVPKKYLRQVDVGFGLWIDRDGWGEDPELNASSASWQIRVENALTVADSYVWVFTNGVEWWTGKNVPQAYVDATRKAVELVRRRKIGP